MQTIVIGHQNPDMDSICSAIAYAELKRKLGVPDVVAASAGNTNERIDLVLQKFGVPAPKFMSDVSPKVTDVMDTQFISLDHDSSIYQAMNSIEQKRIRGLPVVDADNRCLGLLSGWKISQYLFPQPRGGAYFPRNLRHRYRTSSIRSMENSLSGPRHSPQKVVLMVAAMSLASFCERLRRYQLQTNDGICRGSRGNPALCNQGQSSRCGYHRRNGTFCQGRRSGKRAGVRSFSSRYDTATTVLLARGAAKIDSMIDPQFTSLSPETSLRSARHMVAASSEYIFPILESDKHLVGILTKSDFIKPIPRQLILVDHNELPKP